VADPDRSRSRGELVALRRTIDEDNVGLESPTLEGLTAAQEAEAAELLAALFAAAASRRAKQRPLKEAA
jgi:phage major head subunit gpT-like protein